MPGGPCCFNPEPMKDFIDGFLIGDGEDILKEIVEVYRLLKNRKEQEKKF